MVKRLEKNEQNNSKNINNLDKIQRITIKNNVENYQKKIIEIPILINYIVSVDDGGGGIGG
jgi:hypothetical protein